jgi:hypothetical protein
MVAGGVKWHCNDCVIPCIDEEAKIEFLHEDAEEKEQYDRLQALREQYKEYYEAIEKDAEERRKQYEEREKARKDAQATVEGLHSVLSCLIGQGMADYKVFHDCDGYDADPMIFAKNMDTVTIDIGNKKVWLK